MFNPVTRESKETDALLLMELNKISKEKRRSSFQTILRSRWWMFVIVTVVWFCWFFMHLAYAANRISFVYASHDEELRKSIYTPEGKIPWTERSIHWISGFFYFFGQVLTGVTINYVSSRRFVWSFLSIGAMSTLGYGAASDYISFLMFAIIFELSRSSVHVVILRIINSWFSVRMYGRVLGILHSSTRCAMIFAIIGFTLVLQKNTHMWRHMFYVCALFLLSVVSMTVCCFYNNPEEVGLKFPIDGQQKSAQAASMAKKQKRNQIKEERLRRKELLRMIIAEDSQKKNKKSKKHRKNSNLKRAARQPDRIDARRKKSSFSSTVSALDDVLLGDRDTSDGLRNRREKRLLSRTNSISVADADDPNAQLDMDERIAIEELNEFFAFKGERPEGPQNPGWHRMGEDMESDPQPSGVSSTFKGLFDQDDLHKVAMKLKKLQQQQRQQRQQQQQQQQQDLQQRSRQNSLEDGIRSVSLPTYGGDDGNDDGNDDARSELSGIFDEDEDVPMYVNFDENDRSWRGGRGGGNEGGRRSTMANSSRTGTTRQHSPDRSEHYDDEEEAPRYVSSSDGDGDGDDGNDYKSVAKESSDDDEPEYVLADSDDDGMMNPHVVNEVVLKGEDHDLNSDDDDDDPESHLVHVNEATMEALSPNDTIEYEIKNRDSLSKLGRFREGGSSIKEYFRFLTNYRFYLLFIVNLFFSPLRSHQSFIPRVIFNTYAHVTFEQARMCSTVFAFGCLISIIATGIVFDKTPRMISFFMFQFCMFYAMMFAIFTLLASSFWDMWLWLRLISEFMYGLIAGALLYIPVDIFALSVGSRYKNIGVVIALINLSGAVGEMVFEVVADVLLDRVKWNGLSIRWFWVLFSFATISALCCMGPWLAFEYLSGSSDIFRVRKIERKKRMLERARIKKERENALKAIVKEIRMQQDGPLPTEEGEEKEGGNEKPIVPVMSFVRRGNAW